MGCFVMKVKQYIFCTQFLLLVLYFPIPLREKKDVEKNKRNKTIKIAYNMSPF